MCTWTCCAWSCIFLFAFSVFFLTVVGLLCIKESYLINLEDDRKKQSGYAVFIGIGIYGALAVASVLYLFFSGRKAKKNAVPSPFATRALEDTDNQRPDEVSVEPAHRSSSRASHSSSIGEIKATREQSLLHSLSEEIKGQK